jgi:hypothetical protein
MNDQATEWNDVQEAFDRLLQAQVAHVTRCVAHSLRQLSDEMKLENPAPQLESLYTQLQAISRLQAATEIHVSSLRPFAGDAATRRALAELKRAQRPFQRAQRLLEEVSQPLRGPADATKWRDQAAALQVLQGEVELLARSLSQGITDTESENQQSNRNQLLRELAALPVRNPDDGFSNRDHDHQLYGG